MNQIAQFIKTERKKSGLTQEDFAIRSGLGLRFVRELEQGKETCRMDKVNQALATKWLQKRRFFVANGQFGTGGFSPSRRPAGWLRYCQ